MGTFNILADPIIDINYSILKVIPFNYLFRFVATIFLLHTEV